MALECTICDGRGELVKRDPPPATYGSVILTCPCEGLIMIKTNNAKMCEMRGKRSHTLANDLWRLW